MWSIDVLCAARVNRLWICTEEASVGAALESSCLRFLHGLGLEQGAWSAGLWRLQQSGCTVTEPGHEPPTCLLNGGVRGASAKSVEGKDRGFRRGSRKGPDQAGGAGRWSAATSEPMGWPEGLQQADGPA